MAMKLLLKFVETAGGYLIIYSAFLFFLMEIMDISPLTLQAFFGRNTVYVILIVAGFRSWDKVFGKKINKRVMTPKNLIE